MTPPKKKSPLNLSKTSEFERFLRDEKTGAACFCSEDSVPPVNLPKYLGAVDETRSYFRWQSRISAAELLQLLKEKAGLKEVEQILDLIPSRRGMSGRVLSLTVCYRSTDGMEHHFQLPNQYEIRRCLSESFLLSSAFLIEKRTDASGVLKEVVLTGAGWGHGIGLCQIGGVGMALKGYPFEAILRHYYPGTEIRRAY